VFRSILFRLTLVFTVIILAIICIQGTLLYRAYQTDTINRTAEALMHETYGVSQMTTRFYQDLGANARELTLYFSVLSRKYPADVWVVSGDGEVVLAVGQDQRGGETSLVEDFSAEEREHYLSSIFEGNEYTVVGNFGGRFDRETITTACPVFADGRIVAAAFMHSPVSGLGVGYNHAWKLIALSGLLAAALAVIVVFAATQRIILPLRELQRAANGIAKGDLSRRVKVMGKDEVANLGHSFNEMAVALEKQEKTRIAFVANVSHELKSPMTSIQGFTQGMLDGTVPQQEHNKYLEIILSETKRLTKLVRELLDLSQMDSGNLSLHITRFDINEMIRRVIIQYLDRMEEKNIEPEVDFENEYCFVMADMDRISQVVINLVDNAIKYLPESGKVLINTHADGKKVRVTIGDNGNGISREDLPYVFDRFYKVDKSHSDKKGTGLGLAIVKSILEQHGETIRVESQLGRGTSFIFTLRQAPPEEKHGENEKQLENGN